MAFTEFLVPDDPMRLAWARFRSTLAGPPRVLHKTSPTQTPNPQSTLWRLLATNNRELGRSFLLYHSFEAARAHIQQVQARPDSLKIEHMPALNNGLRGWIIMAADAPVMTCSRWYSSLSTGAEAASRALEALRTAELADSPDRSDASGRFRRRAPVGADARP
ncbi:hypothetical protein [Salinibacterium sp. ZJ454]|uniref:hypothetical protein n=1 Tax=Salinibacterium sp. ZJ454 TaxID=2708339 RepID=UPI00141E8D48|nr:hypothetical protein [Salinibacterium sp. ZJ454]